MIETTFGIPGITPKNHAQRTRWPGGGRGTFRFRVSFTTADVRFRGEEIVPVPAPCTTHHCAISQQQQHRSAPRTDFGLGALSRAASRELVHTQKTLNTNNKRRHIGALAWRHRPVRVRVRACAGAGMPPYIYIHTTYNRRSRQCTTRTVLNQRTYIHLHK